MLTFNLTILYVWWAGAILVRMIPTRGARLEEQTPLKLERHVPLHAYALLCQRVANVLLKHHVRNIGSDFVAMSRKEPVYTHCMFVEPVRTIRQVWVDHRVAIGDVEWFGNCWNKVVWEVRDYRIATHEVGSWMSVAVVVVLNLFPMYFLLNIQASIFQCEFLHYPFSFELSVYCTAIRGEWVA